LTFDAASQAPSWHCMNGYVSENSVYLWCFARDQFEKNGSMLLGKVMWQILRFLIER